MNAATKWMIAIVALLGGNLLAMVYLAVVASNGDTQIIPAYYEQAVNYDQAIDEAARSRALGWSAAAGVSAGTIEVMVRDAAGAELGDARVRVEGYQRAHADERLALDLVEVGGGRYRAPLAAGRLGWHDLLIIVERAGHRFTQRAAVEAR